MSGNRRSIIGLGLAGAAGVVAGAAGAFAAAPKSGPQVRVDGRARFRNKVVLITGATSGIGAAAAKMFAAEGGKVAFCGRRAERGQAVEREIREAGGNATYIRADVRSELDRQAFVDAAVGNDGGLEVCFSDAG